MYCPNCNNAQADETLECHRCGIIFAKWKKIQERPNDPAPVSATAPKAPLYQWIWAFIGAGILALAIFQATRSSHSDEENSATIQNPPIAEFRSEDSSNSNNVKNPELSALKQASQEFLNLLNRAQNDSSSICGHEPLTRAQIKKDPSKETVLSKWQLWSQQWLSDIKKTEQLLSFNADELQTHVKTAQEKLLMLAQQMKTLPTGDSPSPKKPSTAVNSVPADWMIKVWLTNCRQLLQESIELIEPS